MPAARESDRADKVWSEPAIASMIKVATEPIIDALMLALWTGQREGDLLRLPWSAYDGAHIRLRQSKTGKRVVIPVSKRLREHLKGIRHRQRKEAKDKAKLPS
jgi:integrase